MLLFLRFPHIRDAIYTPRERPADRELRTLPLGQYNSQRRMYVQHRQLAVLNPSPYATAHLRDRDPLRRAREDRKPRLILRRRELFHITYAYARARALVLISA